MRDTLLLFAAGCLAGGLNAAAGGGSFVGFPALVLVGLDPVTANASSTVALYPGALASLLGFRGQAMPPGPLSRRTLLAASLVGGFLGAVLLLETPSREFDLVIPWLLLLATLALAFGRRLMGHADIRVGPAPLLAAQIGLGIYGGYFGGAVGIMMMAAWSLLGLTDIKAMNKLKVLLVGATNTIAAITFVLAGAVRWPETLPLMLGGALGGYSGARVAIRLPAGVLRAFVIALTACMTAWFFRRAYFARFAL